MSLLLIARNGRSVPKWMEQSVENALEAGKGSKWDVAWMLRVPWRIQLLQFLRLRAIAMWLVRKRIVESLWRVDGLQAKNSDEPHLGNSSFKMEAEPTVIDNIVERNVVVAWETSHSVLNRVQREVNGSSSIRIVVIAFGSQRRSSLDEAIADALRGGHSALDILILTADSLNAEVRVLQQGSVPIARHSRRESMRLACQASGVLLSKSLRYFDWDTPAETVDFPTMTNSRTLTLQSLDNGKRFRTPVFHRVIPRKIRRLAYGLALEKRWNIASWEGPLLNGSSSVLLPDKLSTFPLPAQYAFVADPSFDEVSGLVLAEGLARKTGRGVITVWNGARWREVEVAPQLGLKHISFPQVLRDAGETFILAEIADTHSPSVLKMSEGLTQVTDVIPLFGLGGVRLVDPVVHNADGLWYLFGSRPQFSSFELCLFWSDKLTGPYREHPDSPICVRSRGARMAGGLIQEGNRLYRFGQDSSEGYGCRTVVFNVEEVSVSRYREKEIGIIEINGLKGPHTVNQMSDRYIIDFYSDHVSLFAWYRRLRPRVSRLLRSLREPVQVFQD